MKYKVWDIQFDYFEAGWSAHATKTISGMEQSMGVLRRGSKEGAKEAIKNKIKSRKKVKP